MENPVVEVNESNGELLSVLQRHMASCDLPDYYFDYMLKMLSEDPPRTPADLEVLLGVFYDNDPKMTAEDVKKEIKVLFDEVKPLMRAPEKVWVAEKLDAPILMDSINLITESEIEKGYTETPFTFEMLKFTNDAIDPNKAEENLKLQKQREREKKKRVDEMKKRTTEMESLSRRLPTVQVRHTTEGYYSSDILVENFDVEVSGKRLIESGKLSLASGRKYGLIGRNGTGKTTLLYSIVRKEIPGMNPKPQILMVEQEIVGSSQSPLEIVLSTDGQRLELLSRLANTSDTAEIAEINAQLDAIEAHKAEPRARTLLSGLGFSDKMITEPSQLLSGGWRMRVALAKILFCKPDILLLDEPTNHLDLDAVLWLEDYLQNFESTILVVSHAREFLDSVCTDIIHLDNQKLKYYKGGYFDFERLKNADTERQAKEFESQQKHIAHVQSFVDRFRYNAKRASMVQSRIKYLDKLEKVEAAIRDDPDYAFNFGTPELVRPPLARIDEGNFAYAENSPALLEDLNFAIDANSKIALLGANGVGKTTLLKLLTGDLKLRRGNHFVNQKARVAMFSQHHVDKLNLGLTALEQLSELYPEASQDLIRKHLAKFGLSGSIVLRPMYTMSGGQKSRISLALSAWTNPHLLIMDEPTNHLDLEAVDALILALNQFTGALVIVSHDQYFVSCVCEEIWYIRSKKLKRFNGDFQEYRTALATNKL